MTGINDDSELEEDKENFSFDEDRSFEAPSP